VPPAGSMAHILIVEDSEDSRDALRILLELEGHHVTVACSGEEGVRMAAAAPPDWALIDIGLPDIDGYETARRIRREGRAVRLVALTGHNRPEDRQQALAAGFDAHVAKPVDPARIVAILGG
jgi:two-component system, sensor histidine kinase